MSKEKFNAWLKSKEPDQYKQTWDKTFNWLLDQGITRIQIVEGLKSIRYWLSQNEGSPKADKKHWSKFIKNWFRPGKFQKKSSRALPSRFDGEPKIIE